MKWKAACLYKTKHIIKMLCFWPKYESIIHNNASSSENIHPLLSSHIKSNDMLSLVNSAWSVHISLLIQMWLLFHLRKQFYGWKICILDGSCVNNCDIFISCLNSDGTHSQPNNAQFLNLFWWRYKLIYILMAWRWVNSQQIIIFGWTIPLRNSSFCLSFSNKLP